MALKGTSYEPGSAGTLTTSNPPTSGSDSAFNSVPAFTGTGTASVITTDSMHGSKSQESSQSSAVSSSAFGLYSGYTATSAACRFYFKFVSLASADIVFMRSFNNLAARWLSVAITSANKIALRVTSSDTQVYLSTSAISANTWYRFEWASTLGNSSNAVINAQLYLGDSTAALDSGFATTTGNTGTGTTIADFRYGLVSSTAIVTVRHDDVAQNDGTTTFIGPRAEVATLAVTAAVSATGVVALAIDASLAVTATITAGGVVGTAAGATLTGTATIAAAGSSGAATGVTVPVTVALTAAGSVTAGITGSASVPVAAAVAAAGVVSASTTAARAVVAAVSAAGAVGTRAGSTLAATAAASAAAATGVLSGAQVAVVATATATGQVGQQSAAVVALMLSATTAGLLADGGGSLLAVTAALVATGSVAVGASVEFEVHATLPPQVPTHRATLATQTGRYRATSTPHATYRASLEPQP